ncbi:FecCD family ABC transporter permease [Nocardioides litoris]|uniref:FecCD family ABC transporter permease n=1 Tax=Nocardioides litoris TaxID=1926648 RepID=UPI001124C696|nr:iron ABC transporter permease [Nocardioides litoris]
MIVILKTTVPLGLVVGLLAGLCLGRPVLDPVAAVRALLDPADPAHVLLVEGRLPRAVLAVGAGGALGVAGLLLQDVLRNPIAGPELLGVSSGAAVVTAAVVVLGLAVPVVLLPYAALAGALVAGALVVLTMGRTRSPDHVALIGAAVSAACGGLVVAVVGLGTQGNVVVLFRYLLGSLAARGWTHVEAVAPWLLVGLVAAALLARRVETLTLGDEVAAGLGVAVTRTRVLAVVVAAVLAAAVASVCGPVAFVALLAPHLARRLARTVATRRVLVAVVPVGAALLLCADQVARLVIYPVEVPVGVATTLVGVPALVLALRSRA